MLNKLIKILGGYTEEEYSNKTQELNRTIDKKDKEIQSCRTDIMESHSKNEQLKQEIETLKDNDANLREIAKLKEEIKAFEKTNGDLIKELEALKKGAGSKDEPAQYYYMYNSFEDMFYIEDGVRYINGQCDKIMKDNSLRAVYNEIWAKDQGHKVTFKEFNDEFNKLYNNRNNELVDDYLRKQLIQVKYFTYSVETSDAYKFTYDKQGQLCYKASMHPVYK